MSIQNGRYSLADVAGHVFVPKKGGLPTEVQVTDIRTGTLEPTQGQLDRNQFYPVLSFRFVTFVYLWDGQQMTANLKWRTFLTQFARKDWWEYWKSTGTKPRGI